MQGNGNRDITGNYFGLMAFRIFLNNNRCFCAGQGQPYDYYGLLRITSSVVALTGVWYHLAYVYDSAKSITKFYVNGSCVGTSGGAQPNYALRSDYTGFSINGTATTPNITEHAGAGKIDDYFIWLRALQDSEIMYLSQNKQFYLNPKLNQKGFLKQDTNNLYTSNYIDEIYLKMVQVLVVAGGGAGGNDGNGGGGGGAGGVLSASMYLSDGVVYDVVVGQGATFTPNSGNGGNSSFATLTAIGGGYGSSGGFRIPGGAGGSGGGGSNTGGGGTPTAGQGYTGGVGTLYANGPGGGGGGSGGPGLNGVDSYIPSGGTGGIGIFNPIIGSTVGELSAGKYWIAGGGGGGANGGITQGGLGGGGGGSNNGTNGLNGTGGGGGGAFYGTAGIGGSGVVILSIPTFMYSGITTGSPIITTYENNTIITFFSNGSYKAKIQ